MEVYNWTRYWYKSGDSSPRAEGFLSTWGEYENTYFPFEHFSQNQCLILLGEPGMGKSVEIEGIARTENSDENTKLYVNLNSIGNENRLIKKVFESEKIENWKRGNGNFYLYLDSLDEALLNINVLSGLLADEISELPTERLFLRVACRSAVWSSFSRLNNKLNDLWKDEKFQSIRLAPLTSQDALEAAQTNGYDGEKFLRNIFDKGVVPLAAKPVTLKLLLGIFKDESQSPANQYEIYEQGCLRLCEEDYADRPASMDVDEITSEQRRRIAARIAAIMIFSNKSSIWIGQDTGERTDADISISELTDYPEINKDNSEFKITERNIRETIRKGLFKGEGINRIKFDHQTFAEFLAAWYLNHRDIPDKTVIEIIGEKYLHPQLYEVSAWIASQRVNIFRHLMKVAPSVLLRSDVISADENLRTELAERLLELFNNEEARDDLLRGYYHKLKNPKLAKQIRPYIIDSEAGWLIRRVAIDIAEACELIELQDELANVALDKSEKHYNRINAAYAVTKIADSETKKKLKPLIYEDADENLELRGRGLAATWNEHLTAEELFEVLESPPLHFHGSYDLFIYNFDDKLGINDLPIALNWLSKKIATEGNSISGERIANKILLRAWKNLDRDDILIGFVNTAIEIIEDYKDVFESPSVFSPKDYANEIDAIKNDTNNRRKIWLKAISIIAEKYILTLNQSHYIGVGIDDIEWLVEQWKIADTAQLKDRLLSTLKTFISHWGTPPAALSKIYKAHKEDENLEREFKEVFEPVILESDKAHELRKWHEENFSWQKKRERKIEERDKPISPSPKDKTLEFLEKFENGENIAWIQINWCMSFLPNGRSASSEFEADLTELPVWEELEEKDRLRIIEAAKKYVLDGNPEPEKWAGKDLVYPPALAGYRAINLLERFEPAFIENLDKEIWAKWSPIIYYFPIFNGSGSEKYEKHRQLIAKTYRVVPDKIIEWFQQEIENKSEDSYWSFEKLEYCWDEKLQQGLKAKLDDDNLPVTVIRQILTKLLELNDNEAEDFACGLITYPIPTDEKNKQLLITATELLISFGKLNCWQKIWQILENDIKFGKHLIESGIYRFRQSGINSLSEKDLADLYIWLSKNYPHNEDPVHHGTYSPNERDEIVSWRNSIIDILVEKGTIESAKEVKRVKESLTHLEFLKFTVINAEEKTREKTWQPLSPQALFELFYLEHIKHKVSKLQKELIPFNLLDKVAKRRANFRAWESLGLVSIVAFIWIAIVIFYGWDNTMEMVASFIIPIIGWIIFTAIANWYLDDDYLTLSINKILEQETAKIYGAHNLTVSERESISKDLEKARRELKLL